MGLESIKNTCSVVPRFIFSRIPEEQFKLQNKWNHMEGILKTAEAQLTADQCCKLQVCGVRKGADLASL